MNKFKKVLNTLKYLPVVALPFLAQDLIGQIIFPKGVLNPFIPQDTTEAAKAYEKISTQSGRNSEIFKRVRAGWVYTIPTNFNPALPEWDCNERKLQQIANAMNCIGVYMGGKLLFDGYNKFVRDSIYKHKGTLFSTGDDSLPMIGIEFSDPVTAPGGHGMNGIFSGKSTLKFEYYPDDLNIIEPRDGLTEQKPGDGNIPKNCQLFVISYPYIYADANHEKNLTYIPILKFKIVNGEMILTYNINDDPMFNKDVRVITERDTLNPEVGIEGKVNGRNFQATYNIVDKDGNFKSACWSIDGGKTKTSIGQSGTINLTYLPYGDYNLIVKAEDYFRIKTTKSLPFKITTNPPEINILSPLEGIVYDKNPQFQYNITDKGGDLDKVSYSVNGGAKLQIEPTGTTLLILPNGTYKIVMEAWDHFPQVSKDSVTFEIKKTVGTEDLPAQEEKVQLYPNPVKDYLNIIYGSDISGKVREEIYSIDGKLVKQRETSVVGGTKTRTNVTDLRRGMYIIQIINGPEKQRIKFIKE